MYPWQSGISSGESGEGAAVPGTCGKCSPEVGFLNIIRLFHTTFQPKEGIKIGN